MKKFILLLLSISIIISSCSKEEEVEYAKGKSMTAKIDGNLWRAVNPTGSSSASGMYVISGESKVGHKITLYVSGIYEGEFTISAVSPNYAEYVPADENQAKYTTLGGENSNGKIVITKLDQTNKKATGTFNFTANQVGSHSIKTISSGKFENIEYTYIAPNPANNMMVAKLNGSQWNATSTTGAAFSSNNQMSLTGTDGLKSISMTLPITITPGTYTVDGSLYNISYQEGGEGFTTQSGTITISSHNASQKTITGTFSFSSIKNSDNTVQMDVTNGSFSVVYTLY